VAAILEQLGLDQTFFIQFAVFVVLFVFLGNVYFKPFLKLIQARHKRTVEDREAAEKLMADADQKFEEYRKRLAEERAAARKDYENLLTEVKKEESAMMAQSRSEAKKITQEAADSVNQQREQVKRQLEADVESLAKTISETLLLRRE
jgi:F0F1-type ATP synthase membrane subunit b/b'